MSDFARPAQGENMTDPAPQPRIGIVVVAYNAA
jgi:hypothetical protein